MSEPSTTELKAAGRATLLATLAFVLVTAGLLAGAASRDLSATEASLIEAARRAPTSTAEHMQTAWAAVVGHMERPARWLAVLATLAGVALIVLPGFVRLGGATAGLLLLALCASPAFWEDGGAIGGSAPFFFLAAAVAGAILLRGGELRSAGRWSLVLAALLPSLLGLLGDGAEGMTFSDRAADLLQLTAGGEDAVVGGLPVWVPGVLGLGIVTLILLSGPGGFVDVLTVLGALALTCLPGLGFDAARPDATLASLLPGLALLVAAAGLATPGRTTLLLLVLLVPTLAGEVAARRADEAADPRDSLDWVAQHVSPGAWLITAGPRGSVYRYYEETAHRTGHASHGIATPEDARLMARHAAFVRIPLLILLGADDETLAFFLERYTVFPGPEGMPEDLHILRYRTG